MFVTAALPYVKVFTLADDLHVPCYYLLGLLLCAKTKLAKVQLASYFAEGAANAEKKRCTIFSFKFGKSDPAWPGW